MDLTPEEEAEEVRLEHAFEEYVHRSVQSQNGWSHGRRPTFMNAGPHAHLDADQRLELAKLRAMVRVFLLRHPAPREEQPDMPF